MLLAIIDNLSGVHKLLIKLLYGTGLRLTEGLSLRVKDIDFEQNQITVRDTKGNESRVTMLPESIAEELKMHLQGVKLLHLQDLEKGYGSVYLAYALERKYVRQNTIGFGNLSFLPVVYPKTPVAAKCVAITYTKVAYKKP
ncbi:tyrosine-type recombinase/integrase [Brunnivagina elsteri]|uniref:tyrosine-type recombinase/integrase n=1 Tax=Brunnivagina elsteri TaxID=1247191 RepID=UPI001B804C98|nr:tyrosine-type recombinase/integrase [Calothrix elsteri]